MSGTDCHLAGLGVMAETIVSVVQVEESRLIGHSTRHLRGSTSQGSRAI